MKLNLLTKNPKIIDLFKKEGYQVQIIDTFLIKGKSNYFIEHQESYIEQLYDQQIDSTQKVFYFIPHNDPNIQTITTICEMRNIQIITDQYTLEQILNKVNAAMKGTTSKKKEIVGFFSTQPNIGLTTAIKHLAKELSATTKLKIAVLTLNPYSPGVELEQYDGKYLDEIKNKLEFKSLDNLFEQIFHKQDGYYFLAGNRNIRYERSYQIEEIAYLIETTKQLFDVVFLDVGSYFDHAGSVQALEASEIKVLMTTQENKAYDKFEQMREQLWNVLGITSKDFVMVVNRYEQSEGLPNVTKLSSQYQMVAVAKLPYEIMMRNRLYGEELSKQYQKEISFLENLLINKLQLPLVEKEVYSPFSIKRFFKKTV